MDAFYYEYCWMLYQTAFESKSLPRSSYRIAARLPSVLVEIAINVFVFYFFCVCSAGYVVQEDVPHKTQKTYSPVEKVELVAYSFGKPVPFDRIITDAVFEYIVFSQIPDFVQVVRIFIFEGIAVLAHGALQRDRVRPPTIRIETGLVDVPG